jgi:hypothetical protein
MGWITNQDMERIQAFYGSVEDYQKIPGWDRHVPSLDPDQPHTRLDHGYDETKKELTHDDLRKAAEFRGGTLVTKDWEGNMHLPLDWLCCQGHAFRMSPHAVLKGGHWCIECISPPWNYQAIAGKNRFARQVMRPEGR